MPTSPLAPFVVAAVAAVLWLIFTDRDRAARFAFVLAAALFFASVFAFPGVAVAQEGPQCFVKPGEEAQSCKRFLAFGVFMTYVINGDGSFRVLTLEGIAGVVAALLAVFAGVFLIAWLRFGFRTAGAVVKRKV